MIDTTVSRPRYEQKIYIHRTSLPVKLDLFGINDVTEETE